MEIQIDSDMYVAAAQHVDNLRLREGLYLQGLRKAQSEYGRNSLEAGLILLDLSDCVQAQGQDERADHYTDRAFEILRQFVKCHPDLLPDGWLKHLALLHVSRN